jgi:hypothetical protein
VDQVLKNGYNRRLSVRIAFCDRGKWENIKK